MLVKNRNSLLFNFIFTVILIVVETIPSSLSNDDVRCFCNLASCVRSGYMCKSSGPLGGCFSQLLPDMIRKDEGDYEDGDGRGPASSFTRHGCLEHLPKDEQNLCKRQIEDHIRKVTLKSDESLDDKSRDSQSDHNHHLHNHHRGHTHHYSHKDRRNTDEDRDSQEIRHHPRKQRSDPSALHQKQLEDNHYTVCCVTDMCNYIKNLDMSIQVERRKNPSQKGAYVSTNSSSSISSQPDPSPSEAHLWWFRVAVIVVPITGSVVLVLLILIAARVLRQDSKRRKEFAEIRRQRQLKSNLLLNGVINKTNVQVGGSKSKNHHHQYNQNLKPQDYNNYSNNWFMEKNITNDKLNQFGKGTVPSSFSSPSCSDSSSACLLTKNFNVNLVSSKDATKADDSLSYDVKYVHQKPLNRTLYDPVFEWIENMMRRKDQSLV